MEVYTDDVEDPMFFLGVLSTIYELTLIVESLRSEEDLDNFKTAFANSAALKTIFAAARVRDMIGIKGYQAIIEAYNHPMMRNKDVHC